MADKYNVEATEILANEALVWGLLDFSSSSRFKKILFLGLKLWLICRVFIFIVALANY